MERLRRQDHLPVRPLHDRARDSGLPAGDVGHRDLAQPDLIGNGRCQRRGQGLAGPAAGHHM